MDIVLKIAEKLETVSRTVEKITKQLISVCKFLR